MCGPAAPITCDNALRANEILELTRHVKCVWGCYCAQGYLRNNYNGKCVSENECRNTKFIDISPQIPGLFKHIHPPIESGCDSNGCGHVDHSGEGCGPYGCGPTDEGIEFIQTISIRIDLVWHQHNSFATKNSFCYAKEHEPVRDR